MRGVLGLAFAVAATAHAATIRPVGVLGNSGEAGDALVRVTAMPLGNCASGAAIDGDWTLWPPSRDEPPSSELSDGIPFELPEGLGPDP